LRRIYLFVSGAAGPYRLFSDNMLSENEVFRYRPRRRPKKRPVKSKKKLCHFGVVLYKDLAANLPDTRNLTPKICVAK
jgi:hypothetical protein